MNKVILYGKDWAKLGEASNRSVKSIKDWAQKTSLKLKMMPKRTEF